MAFFDFLKGIFPEKLINIDNRKIDNRKVIINNSSIRMGDQIIETPASIDRFFEEFARHSKEDTLPANVVHSELADDFLEYEQISIKDKETLTLLKAVLPTQEVECILMARRVVRAFEQKNIELATQLSRQLEKSYPDKGKRVLNLMGAGYFDEMILPFIEIFKAQHGNEKYIQEYQKFYVDILRFFPTGVFVGNLMTESKLKEEILKRLTLKGLPFIRLHAIGEDNMKKIENVTKDLKIEKLYSVKDNHFIAPSGIKGQFYEIKISEN